MTEKLGSGQFFGDGTTIDGNKRLSARLLSWWMRCATYSFPVPLAPLISTDILVGATRLHNCRVAWLRHFLLPDRRRWFSVESFDEVEAPFLEEDLAV